jgi:glutamate carboxypeptidase
MNRLIACALLLLGTQASAAVEARYLALLQKLVQINSGTENTEGLEETRKLIVPELEELGFSPRAFTTEGRKTLAFDFPGEKPRVLLVGHIDTVFPPASPFQKATVEGDRVRGPGVIDMKGGVVLLLNALALIQQAEPEALKKIRIVINDDEETGSITSQARIVELGQGIPYGLVFEPGLPDGSLVTSLSGVLKLDLRVKGKAAHAGLDHAQGINACVELGAKLERIARLTDYAKRLTVSAGVIQGGTKRNVVCEEASAQIDIRYLEKADLAAALGRIRKIARESVVRNSAGQGTTSEVKEFGIRAAVAPRASREVFTIARQVAGKMGRPIRGAHVGYVCDANELAEAGMSILAGLGPVGGGMHTDQEFMSIPSYEERLQLSVQLIRALVQQRP